MVFKIISLAFSLAFCSLFYELIFAKALSLTTDNLIIAQTSALGFYFLGMGLGAAKKLRKSEYFFYTECILSVLGCLSPILLFFIHFIFQLYIAPIYQSALLPILLIIPFVVGFFTGKEFLHLLSLGEKFNIHLNSILAATYFGNLFAGLIFPLYIYQKFGIIGSSFLAASINLIAATFLAVKLKEKKSYSILGLLALSFFVLNTQLSPLYSNVLSLSYTEIHTPDHGLQHISNITKYTRELMPSVEQYRSKYQDIDLVTQKNGSYTLFLNRKPQFSSINYRGYHSSMVKGFLNLHSKPIEKVLILGGGDGIIAHYLQKENITNITLVDLDPYITRLAKKDSRFTNLNQHSLSSTSLKLIVGDAFSFLLQTESKFDAVFIDFPLPTYLELSKLYSKEFYSLVFKSLAPGGGVIFDSPINFNFKDGQKKFKSKNQDIIYSTLMAAKISIFTGFGPHENFIYFNQNQSKRNFNYSTLPKDLPGRTFVNLIENSHFLEKPINSNKHVNSIFKPKRFKWKD